MFTGIIEELGRVDAITDIGDAVRIRISGTTVVEGLFPGDSIAVNGACLTAVEPERAGFVADVMRETLERTSLGQLSEGATVNLERAMPADGRFGGHIVQGHIDGPGTVAERERSEHWDLLRIALDRSLGRYLVAQGSVTVDGVSLTVVDIADDSSWFTVSLIPTTLKATTLGMREHGSIVNLELDILAKYVERLLSEGRQEGRS